MSSAALTKDSLDQLSILRKLADLVSRLRNHAGGAESPGAHSYLSRLQSILYLFSIKLIEQWQIGVPFGLTGTRLLEDKQLVSLAISLGLTMQRLCPELNLAPLDEHIIVAGWREINDEQCSSLFSLPCLLGYVYQYFALEERQASLKQIQKANKETTTEQLIAFTQLYTPDWVVDYLLDKTLSHFLASPVVQSPPPSLIDPACGSGHFLIPAFQLITSRHIAQGMTCLDAAQLALASIYGADIDANALFSLRLSLLLNYVRLSGAVPGSRWTNFVCVSDRVLGSLDQSFACDHVLAQQYDCVVTNPPYIGRKLMSRQLKAALKAAYSTSYSDLCGPFLLKGLQLLKAGGKLGYITQSALLSLPSYTSVRRKLIEDNGLECAIDLGHGVFPLLNGEKADSVLVVAQRDRDKTIPTTFVDLRSSANKEVDLRSLSNECPGGIEQRVFSFNLSRFSQVPNCPFQYSAPPFLLDLLHQCPTLSKVADVRQGLATTDNKRFVRYWWEVDAQQIGKIWFPYVKGAGSNRWYNSVINVVDFADNGREIKESVSQKYPYLKGKSAWVVKNEQYYFRPGLCFSFVSTDQFGVRLLPPGCIFDVAASAVFVPEEEKFFLLGYLNSGIIRTLSKLFNPTINVQVGDVKRLPLFAISSAVKEEVSKLASECVDCSRTISAIDAPPALLGDHGNRFECFNVDPQSACATYLDEYAAARKRLLLLEEQIDDLILQEVCGSLALSSDQSQSLNDWLLSQSKRSSRSDKISQPTRQNVITSLLLSQVLPSVNDSLPKQFPNSPELWHWLQEETGRSIDECIVESLGRGLKHNLRNAMPPNWQRGIKQMIDQAQLALKS